MDVAALWLCVACMAGALVALGLGYQQTARQKRIWKVKADLYSHAANQWRASSAEWERIARVHMGEVVVPVGPRRSGGDEVPED